MNKSFTPRDSQLLETIYDFGGRASFYQLKRMFFPDVKDSKDVRVRLDKLCDRGYLIKSDDEVKKEYDLPYDMFWLGEKGIIHVAGLRGKIPASNWRPGLKLSIPDFSWVDYPILDKSPPHELDQNDIRSYFEAACKRDPDQFELEDWYSDRYFQGVRDKVWCKQIAGNAKQRKVEPDGFFIVARRSQVTDPKTGKRKRFRSRIMMELDRGKGHTHAEIMNEKVFPFLAWVRSDVYAQRFGIKNRGRYLFVTRLKRRMFGVKRTIERYLSSKEQQSILLAHFEDLSEDTVLNQPVWWMPGQEEPVSLFPSEHSLMKHI